MIKLGKLSIVEARKFALITKIHIIHEEKTDDEIEV